MVYFLVVVGVCLVIPVIVFVLFAIGDALGIHWYVTAVSVLLMGRFIFGVLEH
jgi:hypothetical protein